MNVGAPLIIANPASTQFVRTDISRQYTRYFTSTVAAPAVAIVQWFFPDFATCSGLPPGADAVTASTCRSYSRIRYDPGVQTAITSSILGSSAGRDDRGHLDVVSLWRGEAERVADRFGGGLRRSGLTGVGSVGHERYG
jgi:hypothetical protein